ncbi:MAG: YihY family inner membrane protein [Oscillospiraceae bacterium]|nr:YihY family inner membrane protein [Oscillospiraceae bacterium]
MKNWKQWRFVRFFKEIVRIFTVYRIPRTAAALAYVMVLTLFPLLICLYDLLALVMTNPGPVMSVIESLVLPRETTNVIEEFLRYVAGNANWTVFFIAFSVMLMPASGVFRTFLAITEDITGARRFGVVSGTVVSFLFAFAFLPLVFGSIILVLASRRALNWVDRVVPWFSVADWWSWMRFVLLFLLLLAMLWLLYRLTVARDRKRRQLPGAFFAALGMAALSVAFSWLFGHSSRYPVVYGSLASVVILLLWLDSLGLLMTLGCAFNEALERTRTPVSAPEPPIDAASEPEPQEQPPTPEGDQPPEGFDPMI